MSDYLKNAIIDHLAAKWGFTFNAERNFYENKTHDFIFSQDGENIYLTSRVSGRCTGWNRGREENVFDCIDGAMWWN
jgi:hypothetical protein